jgi:predicted molibdopterin-dependent oxidoreductase YjgC
MRETKEIEGVNRGAAIPIALGDRSLLAHEGESIASALFRAGVTTCKVMPLDGQLRGYYCGMGVCFECVVYVDGVGEVRACRTPVAKGLRVRTIS